MTIMNKKELEVEKKAWFPKSQVRRVINTALALHKRVEMLEKFVNLINQDPDIELTGRIAEALKELEVK